MAAASDATAGKLNWSTHVFTIPKRAVLAPEDISDKWEKSEVLYQLDFMLPWRCVSFSTSISKLIFFIHTPGLPGFTWFYICIEWNFERKEDA